MQKRKIKSYIREIEQTLKGIREEEKKCFDGDTLRDLYLKEEYFKGQLFACKYILNNC